MNYVLEFYLSKGHLGLGTAPRTVRRDERHGHFRSGLTVPRNRRDSGRVLWRSRRPTDYGTVTQPGTAVVRALGGRPRRDDSPGPRHALHLQRRGSEGHGAPAPA